jgi:RNA polymerase sigma-70 factor (ECF subfamily)
MAPADEAHILKQLSQGSEQAFNVILDRYESRVFHVALRILRSRELAREVVQEVFLKIWIKREMFAEYEGIEGFCFTAARNQTLNMLDKLANQGKLQYEYLLGQEQATQSVENSFDFEFLEEHYQGLLKRSMDKLPEEQLQVYRLFNEEKLPIKDIATQLNLTTSTVKYRLKQVRRFLRDEIEPHLPATVFLSLLHAGFC